MKTSLSNKPFIGIIGLLCLLLNACVNSIEEGEVSPGSTPMTFSVKINPGTKITDNSFDKGDAVGLFAMLASGDIAQSRYIDNMRLVCDGSSNLIPEQEIFYPEGGAELNLVSYYPYEGEGISMGESTLEVSVQTSQHTQTNLSLSDFLVAEVDGVVDEGEPIELDFKHKLMKIEIVLSAGEDEDIDDMLDADPYIIASGFKTQARYDFLTGEFTDLDRTADIIPYGSWKKSGEKLVGKEFIVIPQESDEEQALQMEWNGRIYTCPIPDMEMESNTVCEISINAFQSASNTLSAATARISEWENKTETESDTDYDLSTVRIASLSFKSSHIYRVHYEGEAVAEICKEYLLSEDASLASEAIVVYPVANGVSDLTQGIVLGLKNQKDSIHGGLIEWDELSNSFTYYEGESAPVDKFYINQDGEICLTKPNRPADVNVAEVTLRDTRGGTLEVYPVVKIGTQYWMAEDLRATQYAGTVSDKLDKLSSLSGEPGYLKYLDSYYYTGEAVLAGELAPDGWKIPDNADFAKLNRYIHEDVSLIKGGTWEAISSENEICPVTNLTGLNMLPNGLYRENDKGKTTLYNRETAACYWMAGDGPQTLSDQAVLLMYSSNAISTGSNKVKGKNYYLGLNIRCVKK